MTDLLRLYVQIALLRQGPQDVPAAGALLVITVAGYFLVNYLMSSVLPPIEGPWLWHLIIDVLFTLAWYALLLRITGRPERFVQTTGAVFGFQAVLSPLWIATGWLLRRFADGSAWQFPVSLLGLSLVVWMIAVNAHILKAALEWSIAPCVALVILQILLGQLLLFFLLPVQQ